MSRDSCRSFAMSARQKLILLTVAVLVVKCTIGVGAVRRELQGGPLDEQPVTNEVRTMVKQLEPQIRAKYPGQMAEIEPVSFRTQIVAGTNYLIRAKVLSPTGEEKFVHLRLWKTLFNGVKFGAIKTQVNQQTPLSSFMESDV